MPDPGTTAASLQAVSKRFGELQAVDGLSLDIPRGTIVGVIGPSGAGKTTTIRMLTGAVEPDSGTARVLGEDPLHLRRTTRQRIGYMPQLFTLYRDLSVRENVDFVASLFGLTWRRRWSRTREVLRLVELWDPRGRLAGDLSGGQQRRLELACALVHDPDFMILDEPTAGIDPILRATVWEELHRLRETGRTLVVTTQYVGEAEECDTVALIADGRLVAVETPEGLRQLATGGDVIEVVATGPLAPAILAKQDGIRSVRSTAYDTLLVTVDDASQATPIIVEAIGAAGVEVAGLQEIQPSFDDVFAMLVERSRAEAAGAETQARAETAAPA